MHDCRANLAKPRDFAFFKVDGMTIKAAFTQKSEHLISIQVIAGLGKQIKDPGNFRQLLTEMGLHQAIGMLGPKRAQGGQLIWRRCRRKARCNRIGGAAFAVPFFQQCLAVIIGRLCRVAQINR